MQVILTFKVASHGILLSPFPRYSVVPVTGKYVKQTSKALYMLLEIQGLPT